MKKNIITALLAALSVTAFSQANIKSAKPATTASLLIEKFDINVISGKFSNGRNGIRFVSEIRARMNKIRTTITNLKGAELVYIETALVADTSKMELVLRYFNKDLQYDIALQTFTRISGGNFHSKVEFEKYAGEKMALFPEIKMIPQLCIALSLLKINGKIFLAAQQLYRSGLIFATYNNQRDVQFNQRAELRKRFASNRNEPYGKIAFHPIASASNGSEKKATAPKNMADIQVYGSPGVDPVNVQVARTISLQAKLDKMQKDPCYCDATCPPGMSRDLCEYRAEACVQLDRECSTALQPTCTPYPNPDDGCFGMCGSGCECWSWICGDCCYHDYCAEHDTLCRAGGIYVGCAFVIPFGSTCSSPGLVTLIKDLVDSIF